MRGAFAPDDTTILVKARGDSGEPGPLVALSQFLSKDRSSLSSLGRD